MNSCGLDPDLNVARIVIEGKGEYLSPQPPHWHSGLEAGAYGEAGLYDAAVHHVWDLVVNDLHLKGGLCGGTPSQLCVGVVGASGFWYYGGDVPRLRARKVPGRARRRTWDV
jgi:hypothetical protein